jgi:hypothetical protein
MGAWMIPLHGQPAPRQNFQQAFQEGQQNALQARDMAAATRLRQVATGNLQLQGQEEALKLAAMRQQVEDENIFRNAWLQSKDIEAAHKMTAGKISPGYSMSIAKQIATAHKAYAERKEQDLKNDVLTGDRQAGEIAGFLQRYEKLPEEERLSAFLGVIGEHLANPNSPFPKTGLVQLRERYKDKPPPIEEFRAMEAAAMGGSKFAAAETQRRNSVASEGRAAQAVRTADIRQRESAARLPGLEAAAIQKQTELVLPLLLSAKTEEEYQAARAQITDPRVFERVPMYLGDTPEQMAAARAKLKALMPAKAIVPKTDTNSLLLELHDKKNPPAPERKEQLEEAFATLKPNAANVEWTPEQAAAAMEPIEPGKRRDVFLLTHRPQNQAMIKALADYDYPIPTGSRAQLSPPIVAMFANAKAYDPSFNSAEYVVRQKVRSDYTSGKTSQNLRSLNTLSRHLKTFQEASAALANKNVQRWNTLKNQLGAELGKPGLASFEMVQAAVTDEAAAAFKASGATDVSIAAFRKTTSSSASPAQANDVVGAGLNLMHGRFAEQQDHYTKTMGGKMFPVASPHTLELFNSFGIDTSEVTGEKRTATPQQGGGASPTPPSGQNKILVRRKSDGQQGLMPEANFDASKYERVK